jgi:hypothetical protein
MFGLTALVAMILPWVVLPAMAVLIWKMRGRTMRAFLALAALVMAAATQSRELFYAIGLGLPYPGEETNALASAFRRIVSAAEWFTWKILGIAALSALLLAWPMPETAGIRALAIAVVIGLVVSALLFWSLTGLRFN